MTESPPQRNPQHYYSSVQYSDSEIKLSETVLFETSKTRKTARNYCLKLSPDVGQFLVDPLDFGFFALAVSNVGNEDSLNQEKIERFVVKSFKKFSL